MKSKLFFKHLIFDNHLFILICFLILSISITLLLNLSIVKFFVPIIGGLLSLLYFIQKQKLAELLLFRELFNDFNSKYDKLNNGLLIIINNSNNKLSDDEKSLLLKYFNLCSEEYLYYRKGYIFQEVWNTWFKGMNIYYENARIRRFWNKELKSESYYGLEKLFKY
ncbi:MAG: hypothetical protein HOG24_05260 [Candidatus Cloacimonetes bacterium]|jgi:hypothetical protein|nr:hypothetical protein [Candidatus Cloacimonadota bacterium]